MSDDVSANLSMPYIQPSQAQKHVTHNEALRQLDALVQLSVRSATQAAPPPAPNDGDRFLLPAGSTGGWAGHDGDIAVFQDVAWAFYAPNTGWQAWIEDEGKSRIFDGSDWLEPSLQNLDHLGIQTTADATNRLAVSSPATLLTHAGSGHQLKLNKATPTDTASLLFQTNWSGRAEMGTAGTDNFEIKVSADGSNFNQSMVADAATGVVSFPSGTSGLADSAFGTSSLTTVDYSSAKGVDLVANSTGLLGNGYNYPSDFSYDPTTAPNLPASFSFVGYSSGREGMVEFLAVDPNQVYRLQCYVMQESMAGDWSAYSFGERHLQYMGLLCFDADKHLIFPQSHMRYKHAGVDSLTTLAAPLTPGDTTVTLADSAGWNETSVNAWMRGVVIFGYKNSLGYAYSHYSRIFEGDLFDLGQVNKTTHVVTLNKPLPSSMGNPDDPNGTWPVGTSLANSEIGGTYKYAVFSGLRTPQLDTWYLARGYMGGMDTSGRNVSNNFPPGTAFTKPFWLPNFSNRTGGWNGYPDTGPSHRVWFTGVSVRPEPAAAVQEVTSGASAGSVEIKVPVSDFATGTISLAPAAQTLSEV